VVGGEGACDAEPLDGCYAYLSRSWAMNGKKGVSLGFDGKDEEAQTGGIRHPTGPSIRAVSSSEASRMISRKARFRLGGKLGWAGNVERWSREVI